MLLGAIFVCDLILKIITLSVGNMVSTIMCPRHQNESWAMIWLGVPCWVSGSDYSNYTIFATTKHSDKWTSERLADITPFEANNALLGIAELTLPKAIGNRIADNNVMLTFCNRG